MQEQVDAILIRIATLEEVVDELRSEVAGLKSAVDLLVSIRQRDV